MEYTIMYAIFTDKAAFEMWHAQWKHDHCYPIRGRNAATGKLVDIGWTTDYTDYQPHPEKTDKRVICVVKPKDAVLITGAKELDASEKEEWDISVEALSASL